MSRIQRGFFMEAEVLGVLMELNGEKGPGLD